MPCHICVTCGVQHAESERPPATCPVCDDERQYVGWGGQRWTTLAEMATRHENRLEEQEPGLTALWTEPHFGIGQRAFLLQTPAGAEGRGALLTGDTIQVVMDRRFVSFMWSFPNHVPLAPGQVATIVSRTAPYRFDRIYGAFPGRTVSTGAGRAVRRSAERYLARMGADPGRLGDGAGA